jgi:hypothetical protein
MCLSLLLGACANAQAMDIQFTVLLDKSVVAPGESVTCSVFAAYEPSAGAIVPITYQGKTYEGEILGYASSYFHFVATPKNGTVGLFSNLKLNPEFISDKGFGEPSPNQVYGVGPAVPP